MQFTATHDVTVTDVTRAVRLTRRSTDIVLGTVVVVVLAAILFQVLYAFGIYLRAAADSPGRFLALLRFESGAGNAALAWLSVLVTLSLPLFLFYSARALVEALRPTMKARRTLRDTDICGMTHYVIDDDGVRSTRPGGIDVFMPWSAFDNLRSDADTAALLKGPRLLFFVPLRAFGTERGAVLAHLRSRISGTASQVV